MYINRNVNYHRHSVCTLTQNTLPSSMSGNMFFDIFLCFFDVFWCLVRPQIDSVSIWDDLRIVHFLSFSVIFFVILVSNSFSTWWYFQPISIPFVRNWMKSKDLFWNPRYINSKLVYINEKWSTSMKPLITTYKHSGTLTQKTLPSSMSGNMSFDVFWCFFDVFWCLGRPQIDSGSIWNDLRLEAGGKPSTMVTAGGTRRAYSFSESFLWLISHFGEFPGNIFWCYLMPGKL